MALLQQLLRRRQPQARSADAHVGQGVEAPDAGGALHGRPALQGGRLGGGRAR